MDTSVVVRLSHSHQSGIARQSLTVRSVHRTSSHRDYENDLQHLRSLVGKTSSKLSNKVNILWTIFNS